MILKYTLKVCLESDTEEKVVSETDILETLDIVYKDMQQVSQFILLI